MEEEKTMNDEQITWTCKDGTEVKICEMTNSHLVNCIKYIERNVVETGSGDMFDVESFDCNETPMKEYFKEEYKEMKAELKRRLSL